MYQRDIDSQAAFKHLFAGYISDSFHRRHSELNATRFSYQTKPNCSAVVPALCAMGILTSDNRITTAALKEMPKLIEPNYTMDIHILTCLAMFVKVGDRLLTTSRSLVCRLVSSRIKFLRCTLTR